MVINMKKLLLVVVVMFLCGCGSDKKMTMQVINIMN